VLSKHTANIYDSGDEPLTITTGSAIGTAVANILIHFDETANRFLKIRSAKTSQNQILAALEDVTAKKWDITKLSTQQIAAGRKKKLEDKKFLEAFLDLLTVQLFEEGMGRGYITGLEESDNLLLGIEEEDIRDIVRRIV
jgi:hypothetical protein